MVLEALSGTFKKIVTLQQAKARKDGTGGFEGYGSIFNNVDSYGDIVVKGAFKDTLPSFLANGFASVGHAWSDIPVATFTEAKEDDTGLWVVGDFHSDDYSQRARQVYQERIDRGKTVGLSIGFTINPDGAIYATDDMGFGSGIRVLKSLDLFEVAIVNMPANPAALAQAVKSSAMCADPMCGCRLGQSHHVGLKFADHAEALLTELHGFTERAKALTALRAKQSRTNSDDQLERITAIHGELKTVLAEVEGLVQTTPTETSKEDTEQATVVELARYEVLRAQELLGVPA